MSTTTAVSQTLLYIAATGLQLAVGLSHKDEETVWFPCITGVILLTQMLATIWSLVWIYQKMDFQGSLIAEATCVFAHMIQLGPLWRCLKAAITKDPKDVTELSVIYLAFSILRDAPFVILQIFLAAQQREMSTLSMASVVVTLLTVCVAHTCATVGRSQCTDIDSSTSTDTSMDQILEWKERVCTVLHLVYRVLVLSSRCLAFGIFVDAANYWILLILALHLCIHWSMAVILSRTRKDTDSQQLHTRYHLLNLVEVFDLVNKHGQRDVLEEITFYCIVALQNATMAVLWFLKVGLSLQNTTLFITVLAAFLVGVSVCVVRQKLQRRVNRVIHREAESISCSPHSIKSTDILMPSGVHIHPTKDSFVVAIEETLHNVYDNKAFDQVEYKLPTTFGQSFVESTTDEIPFNIMTLTDKKETALFSSLTTYGDWKGRLSGDGLSHIDGLQSLEPTHILHLYDSGLISADTKCSVGGAVSPSKSTTRLDDNDDSALDNSCDSGLEKPPQDSTTSITDSEGHPNFCNRVQTSVTATHSNSPPPYRRSHSAHSLSCSTCSSVAHQTGDGATSCSRTYCSKCDNVTAHSHSSSSSGDSDWDTGDTATWNETWPPRRKLILGSHDISALPQQPNNSHEHVRKWLTEIQAAHSTRNTDNSGGHTIPRYPTDVLDQLTGKQPVALRTDSYFQARNITNGLDVESSSGKNQQTLSKFKTLFARICRAENSTVYEQLRGRRNTISGAEMRSLAKHRHVVGQESFI